MTKDATKHVQGSSSSSRVRAPYATQACDVCRRKKIRCNEVKPVCGSCAASKRHTECSWSGENVRVPRTEQHFEALRKRVIALQEYADMLESLLDKCRKEHGGVDQPSPSFRQLRPPSGADDHEEFEGEEEPESGANSGDNIGQELALATMNLKLEDRDLVLYSSVAPFRFQTPSDQPSRFPQIIKDPNAHYVLEIEGMDDSLHNPDIDWSRYLPSSIPLTRQEHDKILDLLFKFFTSWLLRIVPALFLRDMYRALTAPASQPPPKTPHYSPMLHNALVALAAAFSDDPLIFDISTRKQYVMAAKSYIEDECQKPNICVVQALSLIGSFHSSRGDQNLGYLYFGMSIRIGQILGLNVDCSKWVESGLISHDDMLDRNWAHWMLFSLDVCWSLYIGRDCSVAVPSDGAKIPVPFVDAGFDQMPWHYPLANIPSQPNYLSRVFAATCELCIIVKRVMEVVNGLDASNSRAATDEVISKIDLQLNTWKGFLSPEIDINHSNRNTSTPQKLMLHLLYWLTFILLHRPFVNRKSTRLIYSSDKDIDHVKLCKRASDNIMDLLSTWQKLYGLRYAPVTLFQAIFSAGTVYLILATQAASGPRVAKSALMSALSQVELCIQYLREVGKSWQSATNIADILSRLLQQQLKPLLDKAPVPGIDLAQRLAPITVVTSSQPSRKQSTATGTPSPSALPGVQTSPAQSPQSSLSSALDPTMTFTGTYVPSHAASYSPDSWNIHDTNYAGPSQDKFFGLDSMQSLDLMQSFDSAPGLEMGFIPPIYNVNFDNGYLQQQLGNMDAALQPTEADIILFERLWQQTFSDNTIGG